MSAINNIVKNNVTYQVQDARVDSMTGIFEATYNETTFADVVAKYNAGWTIICNKGSHELHMVDYSAGTFSFAATLGSSDLSTLQYEVAKLNAQGWSANNENVQNKLVAGSNVAISGNVISATDTTYTAGSNVSIANNVISATDTTYSNATTSSSGLMSAADKTKLDGVSSGASAVSGTNDGSNWQTITIDGTTKNIPSGGGAEKFICVYDETTYAAAKAAYEAGKELLCQFGDDIFLTLTGASGVTFMFTLVQDVTSFEILLHEDTGWSFTEKALQSALTAGTNITIDENNVISASGGGSSYTFTDGLTNNDGTVSWDYTDRFKSGYGTQSLVLNSSIGYADGTYALAEGYATKANGSKSHAEGMGSEATADYAHAQNYYTIAAKEAQTAIGKFNVEDTNSGTNGKYALIVGNGTGTSARSNALTVDWSGNLVCNNIPAPPTDDGNYVLKCSIVSGVATYSWVSE